MSVFVKIICVNEKFVVPLHPISRQTKMAAETIASLAQLVEHSICNQAVVGSSPTRGSDRFYVFFLKCLAKKHFKRKNVLWALVTFRITVHFLEGVLRYSYIGSLAEWSIAPVLKTGDLKGSRGSNPLASAQELTVDSLGEMFTHSKRRLTKNVLILYQKGLAFQL